MELNFKILVLNTKLSDPNHYICLSIVDALKRSPRVESTIVGTYLNSASLAIENRCNLFLAYGGEEIDRPLCKRLASICGFSAVWYTEDPYEIQNNIDNSDIFDIVFTNDLNSVDNYKNKGHFLPLGANTDIHYREVKDEKSYAYDLSFIGTAWPNRVSLIKKVENQFNNLNYKIALPYNEFIPKPDLKIPESAYLWRTTNEQFALIANRARINLTLHRVFSASTSSHAASSPGPRIFEVAMAGGFQLVDNNLFDVNRYYKDGQECVTFNTEDDCLDKLNYYLANPDERIEIARAAQARTIHEHSYDKRIEELLFKIEGSYGKDILKKGIDKYKENHKKKKLLIVTHNVKNSEPFGGVEVYLDGLKKGVKKECDVYFYVPDKSTIVAKNNLLLDTNYNVLERYDNKTESHEGLLSCSERESNFAYILYKYEISLVHFHHFIGHSLSLPYISKALGVQNLLSIHDYQLICGKSFNLLNFENRYCNISTSSEWACNICLNAVGVRNVSVQQKRQSFIERMLLQFDHVYFNSNTTKRIFYSIYPHIESMVSTSVEPIPADSIPINNVNFGRESVLNIAILGNFTYEKGADFALHIFNQFREDPVIFHVMGRVDYNYLSIINHLNLTNVKFYGGYDTKKLNSLLDNISISLHLSVWPETYCITLSEIWQAGVVPIVFDVGALGERVKNNENGIKVKVGDAAAIVGNLKMVINDRNILRKIRKNIIENRESYFQEYKNHNLEVLGKYSTLYEQSWCAHSLRAHSFVAHDVSQINLRRCGIYLNELSVDFANHSNIDIPYELVQGRPKLLGNVSLKAKKVISYYRRYGGRKLLVRLGQEVRRNISRRGIV